MKNPREKKPKYYLNAKAEFVIENYNFARPFANFFPGIAGKYGIPMWAFYVNRAQAIASFGTKDKDHAILEFFPANKSWQLVSSVGFRTFIKVLSNKPTFYEPFHNGFSNLEFNLTNRMLITPYGLTLEEENLSLGLQIKVEYFTIPNDSFAALVRIVTLKNSGKSRKKIQLLDGLPQIIPFGTTNLFLKKLGRTIEAWMNVENLEKGVPFYKLDVDPTDRSEVIHIKEGNFYLSFHYAKKSPRVIRPIVDPQSIFGSITDLSYPQVFLNQKNFTPPKPKVTKNKTPCAMTLLNLALGKAEEKTIYSVIGYMRNKDTLNSSIAKITQPGYLLEKKEENKRVIEALQSDINTASSFPEFDAYAKQTYLDNIIRGGYPLTFNSGSSTAIFYLYGRKHGDLERDYNKFQIQPTYLSQGNGNYRDMNQNRRCDIWFNPEIKDENLITFFNLLQTDGFNPLVVKGANFTLTDKIILKDLVKENELPKIVAYLEKPFTPGDLILFLQENKIKLKVDYDAFLNALLPHCRKTQEAEHGEGFWTDHWTYNLDLLESYLKIYPEKLKEIFFDKRAFTFYDNTEVVKPRREKYIVKDGCVRQLHSVMADHAKREMIKKRETQPHLARTDYGKGEIYQTTLLNKLLCLLANKLASLDPFGVGIEMEADKPNWFDALNGLPALLGSSLNETLELKRLILIVKDALDKTKPQKIDISEDIYDFLLKLNKLIEEYFNSKTAQRDYDYWDESYALKEDYRAKTRFGLSGKEKETTPTQLMATLNNALKKVNLGIEKARDAKKDIYYTYFINEVKEYKPLKANFVMPTKFLQKKLPLFLESQVHALKLSGNINAAIALYKATKYSSLYDKKLKMYKVTTSLAAMPQEIGRCRIFTPGWLEHESIWLHMEYKYLLEILKQGLHEEFYANFKNVLIPFQKPETYGRSILENSSFLVSSAFPDKKMHGNGFVARLSGSTAEFLEIWLLMNLGLKPFKLNAAGELNLEFKPILKAWLFNKKDHTYSFNFLSKIRVTYYNPKRKDTFGKNMVAPTKILFKDKDGAPVEITSSVIPLPYAEQIRSCQIKRIDVYLG